MERSVHKIPLHLETEDKFLWSLTGRQVFLIGLGLIVGYLAFGDITMVLTPFSFCLGVLVWVIIAAAGVIVALVRVKHRTLENWALVWVLYWSRPRYHLWRPALEEDANDDEMNDETNDEEPGKEPMRW